MKRLTVIDALRGIAAFWVVLYHVFGGFNLFSTELRIDTLNLGSVGYLIPAAGFSGVYLFFVISGFCIHLRYSRQIRDGIVGPSIDFFGFWKRRWVRLYPAYLAAIVLFIGIQFYFNPFAITGFWYWDLLSHLLMIHNLDGRTVYSLNGVFWTLAIEEQLYLLYFLLVYLRNRWGWRIILSIAFFSRFVWLGVSLFAIKLTGFELPFSEGSLANWWIWVLGALAVEHYYGIVRLPKWCASLIFSGLLLFAAFALHLAAFSVPGLTIASRTSILFEPFLWGAGFFILLVRFMEYESVASEARSIGARFVRLAASIGIFSYSLYLTHEAMVRFFHTSMWFLECALCLLFAYAFYLAFEKPFMRKRLAPNRLAEASTRQIFEIRELLVPRGKMSKSISIVIPTYNYAHFIGEASESVFVQTLPLLSSLGVEPRYRLESIPCIILLASFGPYLPIRAAVR